MSHNTKFNRELFEYKLDEHKGKEVIWVLFPNDLSLRNMLKQNAKAYWSRSQRCWYVLDRSAYRELFGLGKRSLGKDAVSKIHPVNRKEFERYQNYLTLKGYSANTVRTYSLEFAQLLYILKDFPVQKLTAERLQSYFLYCSKKLKLSENQIHSRINAVKFYFEKVLHREKMFFDIPRPKKALQLPKALSTQEIKKLFGVIENPKHLLMLKLCYGMGLRVSEIVNLKISDIDSSRMQVLIQRGKGKKDRYVNLPETLLDPLREYYIMYRPTDYLFEGQYGGQYATRSVQQVFRKAMNKAGIHKRVGVHGLRHSYATHLLELGTDISLIQKLLGHSKLSTTQLYTHISQKQVGNVKSPLDRLDD